MSTNDIINELRNRDMVSVIIPIYNVSSYLSACIESVINQTYSNLEIILVDDGSTDGSSEICDEFAKKDPRVVVLHKENQGLVRARKDGLKLAKGEYIGYVDGDDWIERDMYEHMMTKMQSFDVDVVMCGRYEDIGNVSKEVYHNFEEGYYDRSRLLREVYPRMIVGEDFFEWNMFPGVWDKLYRKDLLMQFQMQVDDGLRMGEDAACTYPLMLHARSCHIIHKCLYHYRQTVQSMVKQVQKYTAERYQFKLLYKSVLSNLEQDREIFDLREQWKKYVVFLMIPRSDGLYKDYDKLEYLFPFPPVKRGNRIVLYGAGTYGQRLYQYIKRTNFCHIVCWVDRNHEELAKMQLDVKAPEVIRNVDYDYIVVANTYQKSRMSMRETLISMGVASDKICMIEERVLFSSETEKAYGIAE